MINEEILSEKLKYLILTESGKKFDIHNISLEIDYMYNDKTTIESYRVHIKFDYNGSIEPDVYYFVKDIKKMADEMRTIVGNYVIDFRGKLIQGTDNTSIGEGDIWNIEFAADEKHIFDMSYLIVPNKED